MLRVDVARAMSDLDAIIWCYGRQGLDGPLGERDVSPSAGSGGNMAGKSSRARNNGGVVYLSDQEARKYVESEARRLLGVSSAAAFAKVESGAIRGTRAEAELRSLRDLIAPKCRG